MASFDHFDFLAPIYDRVIQAKPPADLLAHLSLKLPAHVLDVGGGTGRIAQSLVPSVSSITITDISVPMLRQAQKKSQLIPLAAAAEALPWAESSFDSVFMVDALHHVFDQAAVLREMYRVVKTGGSLVIEEPDIATFPVRLIAIAEKLFGMRSHFLSAEAVVNIFAQCCSTAAVYRKESTYWVVVRKEPIW